jgi:WD40 repeat protein
MLWKTRLRPARGLPRQQPLAAVGVALSRDGKLLATACLDRTARLYDTATGKLRASLAGHSQPLKAVVFSPDGKLLATGSGTFADPDRPAEIMLWDVSTRKALATLTGHKGMVLELLFAPDGKTLVSASQDRTLRIWDVAERKLRLVLTGHRARVSCLAFSPDGKTLASGSFDKTVRFWDPKTGKEKGPALETGIAVSSIAFGRGGKTLVTSEAAGETPQPSAVILWDLDTRKEIRRFTGHAGKVLSLAFAADGWSLIAGGGRLFRDGEITVWNVANGERLVTLHGHRSWVEQIALTPDGKRLASAARTDGAADAVGLWDFDPEPRRLVLGQYYGPVNRAAFSPNGKLLALDSGNQTTLWDAAAGKLVGRVRLWGGGRDLLFLDNRTIATAGWLGKIQFWDVKDLSQVRAYLETREQHLSCLAVSPDGKLLASGGLGSVRLWSVPVRKPLDFSVLTPGQVQSLAFSPNSGQLAAACDNGRGYVWDVGTGELRLSLPPATGARTVAFSPNGSTLAVAGRAGLVRLLDTTTWREQAVLEGNQKWIIRVAFSPDGGTVAAAAFDGTVKLWNIPRPGGAPGPATTTKRRLMP